MDNTEQTAITVAYRLLRKQRLTLFVVWGVVVASAVAYAFLSRPVYRAELVLAHVEQDAGGGGILQALGGQFGDLASIAGINVGRDSSVQTYLAILESKQFTTGFILENDVLAAMYEDDWDVEAGDWIAGKETPMWDVLDDFERDVRSVRFDPASGVVRLRIDWYSGDVAAEWANSMGRRLNSVIRQKDVDEARKSIEYLRSQLEKTSIVGIEQSIYELIEAQISKVVMANVREDYAFQVIDPAIAPAPDAQLRPHRPLVIALGLILGFVLGAFAALVRESVRNA